MSESRYSNRFNYWIYTVLFSYNPRKYWKLRKRVTNKDYKASKLRKKLWLIYLKRTEARNACSMGTSINSGAVFESVPYLPHGIAGIFVSHEAHIGKNCCILQNVTIGTSKGGSPTIGDNCVIGAGAVIIGGVKIGNNCKIGANCTVFKDVPDNTTVVCQPPRYIQKSEEFRKVF